MAVEHTVLISLSLRYVTHGGVPSKNKGDSGTLDMRISIGLFNGRA
jgi:hypothetical protein